MGLKPPGIQAKHEWYMIYVINSNMAFQQCKQCSSNIRAISNNHLWFVTTLQQQNT